MFQIDNNYCMIIEYNFSSIDCSVITFKLFSWYLTCDCQKYAAYFPEGSQGVLCVGFLIYVDTGPDSKATYWVPLWFWLDDLALRHGYVVNPQTTGDCRWSMHLTHQPVQRFWNPVLPLEAVATLILSVHSVLSTDRKWLPSHGSSCQVAAVWAVVVVVVVVVGVVVVMPEQSWVKGNTDWWSTFASSTFHLFMQTLVCSMYAPCMEYSATFAEQMTKCR